MHDFFRAFPFLPSDIERLPSACVLWKLILVFRKHELSFLLEIVYTLLHPYPAVCRLTDRWQAWAISTCSPHGTKKSNSDIRLHSHRESTHTFQSIFAFTLLSPCQTWPSWLLYLPLYSSLDAVGKACWAESFRRCKDLCESWRAWRKSYKGVLHGVSHTFSRTSLWSS